METKIGGCGLSKSDKAGLCFTTLPIRSNTFGLKTSNLPIFHLIVLALLFKFQGHIRKSSFRWGWPWGW